MIFFFFCQMYLQDVALPSGSGRNKKRTDRTQDYSSRQCIKSSQNQNRRGWSEEETLQTENITGKFKKPEEKNDIFVF